MTWQQIKDKWEAKQVEITVAMIGFVLVGAGLFMWRTTGEEVKVEVLSGVEEQGDGEIIIDVSGAVARPGVVKLNIGARVGEAIDGAGGLALDADKEWIDKYLNMAAKVTDGQKIFIPPINDQLSNSNNPDFAKATPGKQLNSKININTASQRELEDLPGVGEVTAGKIISGRPFGRIEELTEKKIVGQKVFDQIKEDISVW